jgi:hypothetical protein
MAFSVMYLALPTYYELLIIIASNVSRRNKTVKFAHVREYSVTNYKFITLVLDIAFSPRMLPARLSVVFAFFSVPQRRERSNGESCSRTSSCR